MNVDASLAYAQKHALHALLIDDGGRVVVEEYSGGYGAAKAHPLYSGTKGFWGVTALCAQRDGIFHLDDTVAETFPSWRDGIRDAVTLRMLLQLTAGIGFGGLGRTVPLYDRALATALKNPPGATFTYGGIPLQVFGAVFAQKLVSKKLTPHEYLRKHVLDPAGVKIDAWRDLSDGTQPLPTGASLAAPEWLKYGRYVLAHRKEYADCFHGSLANPRYGLGWWLGAAGAPDDTFYASGSGGQAMYVIPSLDLVVVHFGQSTSFKHDAFLKRLLS